MKKITKSEVPIRAVEGFGHQAGMPVEDWVKDKLNDCFEDIHTFFPNEFFQLIFSGQEEIDIKRKLENTWWEFRGYRGDRFLITRRQIESLSSGEKIGQWQQAGSDLVVFYGEKTRNLNDIVTINVKSHNTARESRDPNIISAQRLLYFLKNILEKDFNLDDVNIWFLGVTYRIKDENAIIENVYVKDLFLLDINRLPLINFDAAIQIQWHVQNMIEREQTKLEFIQNMAEMFLERWTNHSIGKTKRYKALIDSIQKAIQYRIDHY